MSAVGSQKLLGDAVAPPPSNGSVTDPQETRSSQICHQTKFGRYRSNRLGLGRWSQNFLGRCAPLECEAWLTPRNTLLPTPIIVRNLVTLGQIVWAQV